MANVLNIAVLKLEREVYPGSEIHNLREGHSSSIHYQDFITKGEMISNQRPLKNNLNTDQSRLSKNFEYKQRNTGAIIFIIFR